MGLKVVKNSCYGGYGLSKKAEELLVALKGDSDVGRHHPDLVKVVEELGTAADGDYARLEVVELDDDMKEENYEITEYDGWETIREKHREW